MLHHQVRWKVRNVKSVFITVSKFTARQLRSKLQYTITNAIISDITEMQSKCSHKITTVLHKLTVLAICGMKKKSANNAAFQPPKK